MRLVSRDHPRNNTTLSTLVPLRRSEQKRVPCHAGDAIGRRFEAPAGHGDDPAIGDMDGARPQRVFGCSRWIREHDDDGPTRKLQLLRVTGCWLLGEYGIQPGPRGQGAGDLLRRRGIHVATLAPLAHRERVDERPGRCPGRAWRRAPEHLR